MKIWCKTTQTKPRQMEHQVKKKHKHPKIYTTNTNRGILKMWGKRKRAVKTFNICVELIIFIYVPRVYLRWANNNYLCSALDELQTYSWWASRKTARQAETYYAPGTFTQSMVKAIAEYSARACKDPKAIWYSRKRA